ncbi:MAG: DUF429 domain-containing protein [Ornithinibacter sp.]
MDLDVTLRRLFDAENAREWAVCADLLHPDVTWTRAGDGDPEQVQGRTSYLARLAAAYVGSRRQFQCIEVTRSQDGRRIVTVLLDSEGRRSVDVFEIEDGLVRREWEFLLGHDTTSPPTLEVTLPVLGVDGCKAGWVGALLVPGAPRPRVVLAPRIADLVETVRAEHDLRVVGIDIPIGLPDKTTRLADALARRSLPGRASSVFTTLTRPAYLTSTRAEADAVNRSLSGQGVGAQAFALRDKILEVDAWLQTRPSVDVIEVHPELSFATMAGAPMAHAKKTEDGTVERLRALAAVGIARPSVLSGSGYAVDDVLDACAVAWTAVRRAGGVSISHPDPPEVFDDGIAAAIHA